jgi:hypothetical protein
VQARLSPIPKAATFREKCILPLKTEKQPIFNHDVETVTVGDTIVENFITKRVLAGKAITDPPRVMLLIASLVKTFSIWVGAKTYR